MRLGKHLLKILAALAVLMVLAHVWHARAAARVPRPFDGMTGMSFEDEDMEFDDDEDDQEDDDDQEYDEGFAPASGSAAPASSAAPGMPASLMATSASLLPQPSAAAADFAQFAPKNIGAQNFLTPSQFIGLDTQGSSRRNASLDLRNTPIIPKRDVGPWMSSTIDPDLYRNNLFA